MTDPHASIPDQIAELGLEDRCRRWNGLWLCRGKFVFSPSSSQGWVLGHGKRYQFQGFEHFARTFLLRAQQSQDSRN